VATLAAVALPLVTSGVAVALPTGGHTIVAGIGVGTHPVPASYSPHPLAVDASTHTAYVPNAGHNTVPVIDSSDLAVSLTRTTPFRTGHVGQYLIELTNTGAGVTTTPSTLQITMPAGLILVRDLNDGWLCTPSLSCRSVWTLLPGQTTTFTILVWVTAPACSTLTTTVTAGPADATPADNTATDVVTIPPSRHQLGKADSGCPVDLSPRMAA